mmetsp:Transcript_18185/g.21006  ORF Transcript_18185/g.21006 Transcript_18185/m.21006 type:complete len:312 (+) Transcript_18185:272-1207(+)
MAPKKMKAFVGDAVKGRVFSENVSTPKVKLGHLLVKVHYSSLNPFDSKLPGVTVHGKPIGLDLTGVVEEVGEDVSEFSVGDRVFGNALGSLAEYVVCSAKKVAKIPDSLLFHEAAAIPTTYLTGYQVLQSNGFKSDDKLLIIGASGGCGTAGVHIAKALNAKEIVGVCSGKNVNFVKNLGATTVINYENQNIAEVFGEDYFDFIYDAIGGANTADIKKVLKPDGMFVTIAPSASTFARLVVKMQKPKWRTLITNHSKQDLEAILQLKEESGFEPVIETELPFSASGLEEGFNRLKSKRTKGKIIVRVIAED